jgi:hypothetical protein
MVPSPAFWQDCFGFRGLNGRLRRRAVPGRRRLGCTHGVEPARAALLIVASGSESLDARTP